MQKQSYFLLLITLLFIESCNDSPTTTTPQNLKIGSDYQGGKIAYIIHGLITVADTQVISATWGCYGANSNYSKLISGALGWGIGEGKKNTSAIVQGCQEQDIAARVCNDLILNGYSDWYLPSIGELIKIYENKDSIGVTNDGYRVYWSSTQSSGAQAWIFDFNGNGSPIGSGNSTHKFRTQWVRPMRSF
jgi:hypothetical protein